MRDNTTYIMFCLAECTYGDIRLANEAESKLVTAGR